MTNCQKLASSENHITRRGQGIGGGGRDDRKKVYVSKTDNPVLERMWRSRNSHMLSHMLLIGRENDINTLENT